jgi:hypothetical protein
VETNNYFIKINIQTPNRKKPHRSAHLRPSQVLLPVAALDPVELTTAVEAFAAQHPVKPTKAVGAPERSPWTDARARDPEGVGQGRLEIGAVGEEAEHGEASLPRQRRPAARGDTAAAVERGAELLARPR